MSQPEILVKGLASGYEAEHLARVFFFGAVPRAGACTRGAVVYARAGSRRLAAGLRWQGGCAVRTAPAPGPGQDVKLPLCRLLYDLLCSHTGIRPPWGLLTGVRPLNLLRKQIRLGGEAGAQQHFLQRCDVSPRRYAMASAIEKRQRPLLAQTGENAYSLYISIPFCPSRCAYCSFVSRTIQREAHLVPAYLQKLEQELEATAALARECGLELSTIYIGGGTPTALDAAGLKQLLQSVAQHFDTAAAAEYTVEAGRPDCTDAEKLQLLKQYGATRISINPQSLNDAVLRKNGRLHTAADIQRCYEDARRAGHDNINMDLIAGLPGDDEESFLNTLRGVLAMDPENVTLHTLTLKRASDLVVDARGGGTLPRGMIEAAYPLLEQAGYVPYYLYRQKSGVENLENTGWAKPGREGLYNVYIMEEAHSILACGAGASTKLVKGGGAVIKRRYNYKFPADYVSGFESILKRKEGVKAFYAGNMDT